MDGQQVRSATKHQKINAHSKKKGKWTEQTANAHGAHKVECGTIKQVGGGGAMGVKRSWLGGGGCCRDPSQAFAKRAEEKGRGLSEFNRPEYFRERDSPLDVMNDGPWELSSGGREKEKNIGGGEYGWFPEKRNRGSTVVDSMTEWE